MGNLRINRIRTDNFDFETFSKEYRILRLESATKSYVYSAEILDTLKQEDSGAKSICYRGGQIYVLVSREDEESVKRTCARLITTRDLKAPCTMSPDMVRDEYKGIVVQLLINTLPGIGRMKDVKYVNLTGQMYCHHVSWETKKGVYVVLKILVKKDMSIVLEADTFSKKPANYEIKSKHPVFYRLDDQGYMNRCFDFGQKELYMNRRFDQSRASIPFLNIQDEVEFLKSKMGVLSRVIEQYNAEYGRFHHLEFIEAEVAGRIRQTRTKFHKMIDNPRREWVRSHGIVLEDAIDTDCSKKQMERIRVCIEHEYGDVISVSGCGPKICLIHDKEWYKNNGEEDRHVISSENGVQHITTEKISDVRGLAPVINNCINNLIIKDDLTNGHLSIGNLELNGSIVFGVRAHNPDDKNGKEFYLFLNIMPGGGIWTQVREVNPYWEDSEDKLIDILMGQSDEKSKLLRGIIQYGDSVATLYDTSLFTVSENDLLQVQMRNNSGKGRTSLVERTEENREIALVAVTDINKFTFPDDADTYYNVGLFGSGMQTSIRDASLIRRIHIEQGKDISEILLPMMCEGHVRNEQLTVVPFPFKYLHEYALMNNLEADM